MASARGTTSPVKRTTETKQPLTALTTTTDALGDWARPSVQENVAAPTAATTSIARATAICVAGEFLALTNAIAGELVGNGRLDGLGGANIAIAAIHIAAAKLGDPAAVE